MQWRRSGSRSEAMPDVVMLVPDPNFDNEYSSPDLRGVEASQATKAVPSRTDVADVERYARLAARVLVAKVSSVRESRAAGKRRQGVLMQERSRGDGREVVQTCRVRPGLLESVVGGGDLFSSPVGRLEAPELPVRAGRADYVWTVRMRTGLVTRRAGTLHMSSTPSENLTIIELTPLRRSRFGRRRFVFRGIRCVKDLAERVESLAAAR